MTWAPPPPPEPPRPEPPPPPLPAAPHPPEPPAPPRWRQMFTAVLHADERLCFAMLLALSAFGAWPLWVAEVLPLQDFAGNMTYAIILEGAREAESLYASTYETGGWWLPNSLVFYLWSWLGPALGWIQAGKLLLTIYALGLPLSVWALLRAAGRDPRFALAATPLVWNSNLMMGFLGYATAVPLAFMALAAAYRLRRRWTWRSAAAVAAWTTLTWLGHAQTYLVLGLLSAIWVLTHARSFRDLVRVAWPFAVSLLLFLPWFWVQFVDPPSDQALGGSGFVPEFQDPALLLSRLGEYTLSRWHRRFDDWVLFGLLAVLAIGLLDRHAIAKGLPEPLRKGAAKYSLELMAAALMVAYVRFVPEHTEIQAYIGSRLVTVSFLLALGALAMPQARSLRGPLVAGMVFLSATFTVNVAKQVRAYEREEIGERFLPMLDALPDGSRLATFITFGLSGRVTNQPHEHVYGYHFALNGGVGYTHFHSYFGRHARWRDGQEIPSPGWDPKQFLRSRAACWYDFVLLRSRGKPMWGRLRSRVTYLDSSKRYSLWKVEHSRIPTCRTAPRPGDAPEPSVAAGEVTPPEAAASGEGRPLDASLTPSVGLPLGRDARGEPLDTEPEDAGDRPQQTGWEKLQKRVEASRKARDEGATDAGRFRDRPPRTPDKPAPAATPAPARTAPTVAPMGISPARRSTRIVPGALAPSDDAASVPAREDAVAPTPREPNGPSRRVAP